MILSDRDILEEMEKGTLVIKDFARECLGPASYDMRLRKHVFRSSTGKVHNLEEEQVITIEPNEFIQVLSYEELKLPRSICGRFGLRSHFTRKGLIWSGGPQIDPGFEGVLSVTIYNPGSRPVPIRYLENFCTVEFTWLKTEASREYSGPYQGLTSFPPNDLVFLSGYKGLTMFELSKSLDELEAGIEKLTNRLKYFTWAVGIVIPIMAAILIMNTMMIFQLIRGG